MFHLIGRIFAMLTTAVDATDDLLSAGAGQASIIRKQSDHDVEIKEMKLSIKMDKFRKEHKLPAPEKAKE